MYRHRLGEGFLSTLKAEQIHRTALDILDKVGLEVSSPWALEQMAAQGFRVVGGRVFFEPHVVEEHLAERRQSHQGVTPPEPPMEAADDGQLHLTAGVYAHHVHNLETDGIEPYTTDKLIEMTKLVDVLTERGVHSPAPGYPLDVPAPLQPLAKYLVGATYSRHGEYPVDPISAASVPYVMEMAQVLGHPLCSLPVYVFSPLRLAGESLDVVLRFRDRLQEVHVSAMPSLGGTAPVLPFGALALTVAEVLGGFVTLRVVTGLPVDFGLSLFALDLRSSSMVFGSPEAYLLGQLNAEICDFYTPWQHHERGQAAAAIHVRANFPGAQAAAEKAGLMTAGALIGARWFDGAGILAVDEVFSAEQLLVDCEIKDQVQRLVQGLDLQDGGYDWVEEVRQGVQETFMALESTVDHYRHVYWHPRLFERSFLQFDAAESERMKLAQRARALASEYISRHEYALDATRRGALERIWQRATRELA